jgi:hypothetical protein
MIPPDIDLDRLPRRPRIDEANYGWTGYLGEYRCILNGHRDLTPQVGKPSLLDTRGWGSAPWEGVQIGRATKYLEVAKEMSPNLLVYVFEDIGPPPGPNGLTRAKRGGKRFTGLFRVDEWADDGFLAHLIRRAD